MRDVNNLTLGRSLSSNSASGHLVFVESRLAKPSENPRVHTINGNFWDMYTELSTLGEGCLGVVKKCQRVGTPEIFAVKIIRSRDEEKISGVSSSLTSSLSRSSKR